MKKQVGSALIIVLVILVLVTLIGTLAVRSGILGLKLATNSQIQALLLENSNSALFNLEDPAQVQLQTAGGGMYGYFDKNKGNDGDELVFCYRASQSQFFSMVNASVIDPSGGITKNGVAGFCKANEFATGRSAILSQVYLRKANLAGSSPLANLPLGSSLGANESPTTSTDISATVVSVLPSFTDASSEEIQTCFRRRASAVKECFQELNIPFNIQHADYKVGAQPKLRS